MKGHRWAKLGILAIFAASLAAVLLSSYRFGFSPIWQMDPIPFAFFLSVAGGVGWLAGRRR